jgi:hypothetical protein
MGTKRKRKMEREEKMEGIEIMVAIIGAVVILTWYV